MNSFVGFSKGTSVFAKLICYAQLGRFSHAFFAFQYQSKWYVVDSTRSGIKIRSMKVFTEHARLVKKYDMHSTDAQLRLIFDMCLERSYDNYPLAEIIGNALQLIVKWLTFGFVTIRNIAQCGERSPRCHEFVAIILRDVYGYKFQVDLDDTDLLWLEEFCDSELTCRK